MKLVLPYPPSANRYWRSDRGRAPHRSEEAKAYKLAVGMVVTQQGTQAIEVHRGPVAVTVAVYRPRKSGDLDNRLKVLLDALKGIAFEDDEQVVRIEATRHDDKANPRVEVEVVPFAGLPRKTSSIVADLDAALTTAGRQARIRPELYKSWRPAKATANVVRNGRRT